MRASQGFAVVCRLVLLLSCVASHRAALAQPATPANLATIASRFPRHAASLRGALADHGFAVLGEATEQNLYAAYYMLYLEGEPVLVTSDAMLYLWFETHRTLQQDIERQHLLPLARQLVAQLWTASRTLPEPTPREELVALAVALRLADSKAALPAELSAPADAIVAKITAAATSEVYPGDDWQQYRPRGPYADNPELAAWFRLSKWLGRRLVPLAGFSASPDTLARAAWWCRLFRACPEARATWDKLAETRRWLAGPFNMASVDELDRAFVAALGATHSLLRLTPDELAKVGRELASDRYTATGTRSRTIADLGQFPSRAFALLPEHDSPDSRLFQGQFDEAKRPTGLSVAAGLGSARAAELNGAQPPPMAVDQQSIYGQWLSTLATLTKVEPNAPRAVRSAAWRDKTLNTMLTSWAQLKHNNLLYGAEAMVAGGMPSGLPQGWVEPLPTFWQAYHGLVSGFAAGLDKRGLSTERSRSALDKLAQEATWLEEDARRELAGQRPNHEDHWRGFCYVVRDLPFDQPTVVADVAATQDEVLYAGSGLFQPMVMACEPADGKPFAVIGWVGSYYEFWQPGGQRKTDDAWRKRLASDYSQPDPPDWTRSYRLEPTGPATSVRAALRAANGLILDGQVDQAIAQLRALLPSLAGTENELRAQVMMAKALADQERWTEALAAYNACRTMYGCRLRDEAVDAAHSLPGNRQYYERQHARERQLGETLVATSPRPGLSAQAERKRQNERASALLDSETEANSGATLSRVLAECPQSVYVPGVRLALATGPRGVCRLQPYRGDAMNTGELLRLAEAYPTSLIGEVAAGLAAFRLATTEPERAYNLVAPFLDVTRAKEPYPEAVTYLFRSFLGDVMRVQHLGDDLRDQPVRGELRALATAILKALADQGRFDVYTRLWPKLQPCLPPAAWPGTARFDHHYLVAEPDAFRLWVAARLGDEAAQRRGLEALVAQQPKSALAPRALERLALNWGDDRAAIERLARTYPQSSPGLRAASWLAAEAGDLRRARALMGSAAERDGQPQPATSRWWRSYEQEEMIAEQHSGQRTDLTLALFRQMRLARSAGDGRDAAFDAIAKLLGAKAPDLLTQLPESDDYVLHHFPDSGPAKWLRERAEPTSAEDRAARTVDAGPDAPGYKQATEQLARRFTMVGGGYGMEYDSMRARAETFAADHAGQPSADLVLVAAAEAMLAHAWSEQAIELATPARGAGRRFGARADAVVAKARSALDVLHQAARPARWQVAVAEPVERYASDSAPAAITAGSVFFACTAPRGAPGVVALARSDGRVLWRAACGPVEGLATAAGVVAVSRGEQITAFDAGTGRRLWQLQADTPPQADSDRSLLTAAGGRLLFATSGHLTALDPLTGKAAWRQEVPYANRFPTMVAAGKVIVCSQREQRAPRSAIAFDLANGQRLWTLDLSEFPSFGVGTVLLNGPFQTPDGSLVCRLEERTDRGNTLVWRSVDLDRGTLLPAAPHDALSALYPRYGVLPWTGDTEIGQVGPSGSAASWQAETVGGKTRNGYLAVAGQQVWLAVGDNLASLDPASLLPNQRRFLGDQAIGLAADEQEAVVLLANGQAACLAR